MNSTIDAEQLADTLREFYLMYEEKRNVEHNPFDRGRMAAIEELGHRYGIDVTAEAQCFNYIECKVCGEGIITPDFTNECDCGTLYNFAGQMLKPADEWEEGYE